MPNRTRAGLAFPIVLTCLSGAVRGQPAVVNFEAPLYTGSPAGTPLSGQQGWYFPPNFATDGLVCTYAGNVPGITALPGGGSQFLLTRPTNNPSRPEHAYDLTFAPVIRFRWDIALIRTGPIDPPVDDNIGSFSLQPIVGARYFARSNRYSDVGNLDAGWNAAFLVAPPAPGSGVSLDPVTPGPAWRNLVFNHWYRESVSVDFSINRITTVSITDLSTGQTTTVAPVDYYLSDGMDPMLHMMPNAIRFGCSNYPQHATAWDNFSISAAPTGSTCYPNCDASTATPFLNIADFICFLNRFAAGDSYANCDASTLAPTLNISDFICFNNTFAAGCTAP